MPQKHFYGAPDLDGVLRAPLNRSASGEKTPVFLAIDSLPAVRTKTGSEGVILIGSDGKLEVHGYDARKTRLLGRLEGLGGAVVDAKILTWTSRKDPFLALRPLVAAVIHGPSVERQNLDDAASNRWEAGSDHSDIVAGIPNPSSERAPIAKETTHFQTRVEVFSLATRAHVSSLFASKDVELLESFTGGPRYPPPPAGNLKVHASGNYTILTSGTSGEVFIYGAKPTPSGVEYQCIGKTWTSIQPKENRRYSTSSSGTDPDGTPPDIYYGMGTVDTPIISLNAGWLAVVPPLPSSRFSLHGAVPCNAGRRKAPGIDSHTAFSRPAVTSIIDSPDNESLLNKAARGLTQELAKGARWIGDQGLQTWNNYWNKDAAPAATAQYRRGAYSPDPPSAAYFPPTHAPESPLVSNEPEVVSILDLRKLADCDDSRLSSLNPVATFQPPGGCSFLSFSPNGLMLLTASKKGDMQRVWDLLQMRHCKAGSLLSEDSGSDITSPRVRQIAKFPRLTASSILDVVWTQPTGERLAIITRNGTIHLFDIPMSAFQWPPFRRVAKRVEESQTRDILGPEVQSITSGPPGSSWTAALKAVGDRTQPVLAAVRGRAPSVGSPLAGVSGFGLTSAMGVRGGKVVAAGLSKSVGAATGTVNTLRHAGENRLHLSGFSKNLAPARVTWFGEEGSPLIALIDADKLKFYKIRRSAAAWKASKQHQSVFDSKVSEQRLSITSHAAPSSIAVPPESADPISSVPGVWALPPLTAASKPRSKLNAQPLSKVEIETNPPYQPFHTDRRVSLFVRNEADELQHDRTTSDPWVFGGEIPGTKVNLHLAMTSSDDEDDSQEGHRPRGGEIENLISVGGDASVMVTSRRKKRGGNRALGGGLETIDDGFFEDDCDVLDFPEDRV